MLLEETGAEPVKMGTADLEVVGAITGINRSFIELLEDLLEEQVGVRQNSGKRQKAFIIA